MFCTRCAGSGEILGNGMIMDVCTTCDGHGYYDPTEKAAVPIDKKSPSYKDAIRDIKKLNPKLTRKDAEKIFEETYNQV